MFLTIITDCSDKNAQGRQESRARVLFGITPSFISLPGSLDVSASLEASGNIIDVLDAVNGDEGVILANVAPRNADEKKWGNGTPFAYFRYRRTLVVSTVSGLTLSLPRKFGLIDDLEMIDIQATLVRMWEGGIITEDDVTHIQNSQFRSFDFLPRVALWITKGHEPATTPFDPATVPQAPVSIWAIDNFGNIKTTLLERELPKSETMKTRFGTLPIVRSLKDVPDGTAALTVGSSGIGSHRFVEIAMQGESAGEKFKAVQGMSLLDEK
jgi:hypothetical protein